MKAQPWLWTTAGSAAAERCSFRPQARVPPATAVTTPGPGAGGRGRFAPYNKDMESRMLPQMTMATEDYNRLVRMIKQGVKPKMTVDIQTQYHDEDLMGYNTVAEIPGHRSRP